LQQHPQQHQQKKLKNSKPKEICRFNITQQRRVFLELSCKEKKKA
jgi:hypothetical protein